MLEAFCPGMISAVRGRPQGDDERDPAAAMSHATAAQTLRGMLRENPHDT